MDSMRFDRERLEIPWIPVRNGVSDSNDSIVRG